jgi:glucokinase
LTTSVGLELQDDRTVALAVDADGTIVARADGTGRDLAVATSILSQLGNGAADGMLGVAAANPFDGFPYDRVGARTPIVVTTGTACAVAEAWIGAARAARDLVYLAVAEHTTAGILRDGRPFVGAHRRAASVAWLALNPVEREDYRRTGCLEAEVAAHGIVRRAVWRIKAGDESRIVDRVGGDLGAIAAAHVLEAARDGDGVAISVVRDTAKYVGMAAANLVLIVDPAVLVLGGIIAGAGDLLLDMVRTELARRLPPSMLGTLQIVPAALGSDAPAVGAARLAAVAT